MTNDSPVADETASPGSSQVGIKLVVYKEIKPGDLRKFRAESSDAGTGGGARDLRFRPHDRFDPVFAQLFPDTATKDGQQVRLGAVRWDEGGHTREQPAEYWPPTTSRPGEGRWSKVHAFPPFRVEMPDDEGCLVIMLIQDANDDVWLRIETEHGLGSPDWDERVITPMIECIRSQPREDRSAQGYIDFIRGTRFCHAG